jgi:hypothetical protein
MTGWEPDLTNVQCSIPNSQFCYENKSRLSRFCFQSDLEAEIV